MREALVSIDDTDFEELGIEELVGLCRDAGVTRFEELVCHRTGGVVQVGVEERLDQERIDGLESVTEWEHVPSADDGHLYVVTFESPTLSEEITDPMSELVGTCEPELDDRGATMSLVGSQDAIADTIDTYEGDGVRPELRKLGSYDGTERPLAALTDRQREVIRTAWDMGYYEVPRAVSTDDVAADLGLDDSTVSEHLQRAEHNLLSIHLSEE